MSFLKMYSWLVDKARTVLRKFLRALRIPGYWYPLDDFVSGKVVLKKNDKRILLVLNHAIRERKLFESIRGHIQQLAPGVQVGIVDYRDREFVKQAIDFRPQVIMTFPFTALTISDRIYPIKFLTNSYLLTYRAEGGLLDYSGVIVDNTFFVGYDQYGPTLVDRELFWGRKMAEYAAPLLFKQGKLSSVDRIGVVGYPEYERYFGAAKQELDLPAEIEERIGRYPKEKVVLLITGFHGSLYTKDEIRNAKDWFDPMAPDAEEKMEWALGEVDRTMRFKQRWIEKTIESANANPDVLHILKCHPLETLLQERKKHDPYAVLKQYPNVLYVQNVPVQKLLERCGFFLHYGSTTLAEAILLRIPSAFVYSKSIYPRRTESDFAKYSTMLVDIDDLPDVVKNSQNSPPRFELTPEIEKILFDVFNINSSHLAGTSTYLPSRMIAQVLVDSLDETPQSIDPDDIHLLRAMRANAGYFGLPRDDGKIVQLIEEIARHTVRVGS